MIKALFVSIILLACLAYPSNNGNAGVSAGVSGNAAVGVASGPQGAQVGATGSAEASTNTKEEQSAGQNAYEGSEGQGSASTGAQAQNRETEQETARARNGTGNGSTVRTRAEIMATSNDMKEIQGYFVASVKNISQNASPQVRARMVSQIRQETNAAIKSYLETKGEADLDEMESAVEGRITIRPASISTDSFTADAAQKKLTVRVRAQEMLIVQEKNAVSFGTKNGVRATAGEMAVENGTLSVENQEVRVLPSEAAQSLKGEVRSMEMAQVNGRLAYSAKANVKAKLLGLIGTEYEVESSVDAQSGQLLAEKKPWWSFLAFE